MKTALLHYWLTNLRGGEKVLAEFAACFRMRISTPMHGTGNGSESRLHRIGSLKRRSDVFRAPEQLSEISSADALGAERTGSFRIRSSAVQRIGTGERDPQTGGGAAYLLLPHAHAVSLGYVRGVLPRGGLCGESGDASLPGAAAEIRQKIGGGGGLFHCEQPLCRRADPGGFTEGNPQ